jgi:hypothetical protein
MTVTSSNNAPMDGSLSIRLSPLRGARPGCDSQSIADIGVLVCANSGVAQSKIMMGKKIFTLINF